MKLSKLLNIVIVMSLPLFFACTAEEEEPQGSGELVLQLRFAGEHDSRATANGTWTVGDVIAVQVGTTVKKYIVTNESGEAKGADDANTFYWEDLNATSVKVKAWSYGGKDNISDPSGTTITLPEDQSTDDAYYGCDLLYAPEVTLTKGTPATLTFYHQMAMIWLNIIAEESVNVTNVTIGSDIGHPYESAMYAAPDVTSTNPNIGSFTVDEMDPTMGPITPLQFTAPRGYDVSYSAFLLPVIQEAIGITIETSDGETFYYTLVRDLEYQAGAVVTLNITIKNKQLSVSSNEAEPVSIDDWIV